MIIIKTSNGDAFVNEAEMQQVEHLRDKRQVKITTRVGLRTINDVEAVLYATDVSHWQDEGSQVAHLHSLVTKLERQIWHYKGLAEVREDAMREFDRKLDIINEELKTGNIDEVSWQKVDPQAAAAASGEEDITEGGAGQGGNQGGGTTGGELEG